MRSLVLNYIFVFLDLLLFRYTTNLTKDGASYFCTEKERISIQEQKGSFSGHLNLKFWVQFKTMNNNA